MITYGSVCSGIEAASVAWEPMGWRPKFFAEIEAFPSAVLAHHYGSNMPGEPLSRNGVPNHGDFTQIDASAGPVDLLVGGTPCQDFSVAGKRLGLDGACGNLALEYVRLAKRLGARWVVWENVPGVFSRAGGRDFAIFLGLLAGREVSVPRGGWQNAGIVAAGVPGAFGLAWRVLDAQYVRVDGFPRAVPQRRRRVFVVGYLGDWRRAAAVLLEPEGMQGHPAPRREAQKGVAGTITGSAGRRGGQPSGGEVKGHLITSTGDVSHCLNAGGMGRPDLETETFVAHTLRAEGFDASEDGTGRGPPLVTAFDARQSDVLEYGDKAGPLDTDAFSLAISRGKGVRRPMPHECARLQGFADDRCAIRWKGKLAADGPQYKAYGNSMAVPVMRWIGQRIDMIERLAREGRI